MIKGFSDQIDAMNILETFIYIKTLQQFEEIMNSLGYVESRVLDWGDYQLNDFNRLLSKLISVFGLERYQEQKPSSASQKFSKDNLKTEDGHGGQKLQNCLMGCVFQPLFVQIEAQNNFIYD